jgi:hypothetical protein
MNDWCICWFFTHICTGILIFKGLTARRLYKSFGVKGLIKGLSINVGFGGAVDWYAGDGRFECPPGARFCNSLCTCHPNKMPVRYIDYTTPTHIRGPG